jgi:hypothetical protein
MPVFFDHIEQTFVIFWYMLMLALNISVQAPDLDLANKAFFYFSFCFEPLRLPNSLLNENIDPH